MLPLLIDTGAVVAYLDRADSAHERVFDFFSKFEGSFFSTEAVLTESLYLLGERFENQKKCLDFFLNAIQIVPMSTSHLTRIVERMEKYQDVPMDFTDATLVMLAEELSCGDIFTLDRRGFETYRWGRNRTFRIYPE